LHAHVVLWLEPECVQQVANEIAAYVPGPIDPKDPDRHVRPDDALQAQLNDIVMRKQIHRCSPAKCQHNGKCRLGFPYSEQHEHSPVLDEKTNRYSYYRPHKKDNNVVPYHPAVLLLWKAHMNVQLVTQQAWSFYLLKYALKAEPMGQLNLDSTVLHNLGLGGRLTRLSLR